MSKSETKILRTIESIEEKRKKGAPIDELASEIASLFKSVPDAMVHDPEVRLSLASYVDMVTISLDNPFISEDRKATIMGHFAGTDHTSESLIDRTKRLIHDAETNPQAYYRTLGAGGYGYVLRPALPNMSDSGNIVYFPENVTKVYLKPEEYEKSLKTSRILNTVMGHNEGHRINPYHIDYTAKHVAPYLSKELQDKYRLTPNLPLKMVRMPNLGIDVKGAISEVKYRPHLRQIPIPVLVAQIKKLFQQTRSIAANGYIHTDIRDTNVMIDPSTGVMTIIDFDWLKPVKEIFDTYPFGFYNNPPEALLISGVLGISSTVFSTRCILPPSDRIIRTLSTAEQTKENRRVSIFENYKMYLYTHFNQVMQSRSITDHASMDTAICKGVALTSLKEIDKDATKYTIFRNLIAPKFDNYGLGLTLLEYFLHTYPGCLESKTTFRETLRTRITDRGRSYTDSELDTIVSVLHDLAALFNSMGSFSLAERPSPDEVVARVTAIEGRIAPSGGGAAGGGQDGGYRKTRRQRRRRRQTRVGRGKGAPRSG